ncbi:MAG: cell division topological specificity factor MinE [Defluviitaleaceae bacterium]|nr:cell division topological specificity factor MinE [Defluviitaleaceae bacterium]
MENLSLIFGKKKSSKSVAKDRLKLVLVSDRINCNDQMFINLKNDVLKTISNYLEIDENAFEIEIINSEKEESPIINAQVPIKNVKFRA